MPDKPLAERSSFVEVEKDSHFPIQNLPYGVFRRLGDSERHIGVAIGDYVFDCSLAEQSDLLAGDLVKATSPFQTHSLNRFMSLGKNRWAEIRAQLIDLLDPLGDLFLLFGELGPLRLEQIVPLFQILG